MTPIYDYLVIGAGFFGATFARQMTDAGKRCLVIDARNHVGGNCHTEEIEGIQVHRYGPHIFHTDHAGIWEYVQRFASFNHFTYRPRVRYQDKIYSFPINLLTLYQLWGVKTPDEAAEKLNAVRVKTADTRSLEGWLLAQIGEELYNIFYKGYTAKQWGRDPASLPASIVRRVPIRLSFDDNYFTDRYQGIPIGGYTRLICQMLDGIEVKLNCDYFADAPYFRKCARKTVYTGPIDRYFSYVEGRLEYRSLRFEREIYAGDFQGVAAVNYTESQVPYTRIVEHKHFEFLQTPATVITREYPAPANADAEPFYPINDERNRAVYARYRDRANSIPVLFGGRLGTYQYYDMHHVIAQALALSARELADPDRDAENG